MSLIWKDVCFRGTESIKEISSRNCCHFSLLSREKTSVLDNLNGEINFGELTALMGPSGAGKSTLLNFITQGKNYRGCKGKLLINSIGKRGIFIAQDEKDHLLLNLTVYESICYASEIKNPRSISKWKHSKIVDKIVTEMELDNIRANFVGRCSGGEKKRIAIALEFTSEEKPNFLILDEPTSGLDSHSGFNVFSILRKLALSRNMAIVTTVHQPSFDMLELFHRAYIISKGGSCIFSGAPTDIHEYLCSYNFNHSANANPADSIIKVASSVNREEFLCIPSDDIEMRCELIESGNEELLTNKRICEKMTVDYKLKWLAQNHSAHQEIQEEGLCNSHWGFSLKNLWVLIKRGIRTSILRQQKLILIRLALHAIVAVVLSILYKRNIGLENGCSVNANGTNLNATSHTESMDTRNEDTASQNVKFQFFSLLFLMFAALMPTVLTFPAEIKLFLSEHRNGWYSTGTYYISKTLVEIPIQFLFAFCYTYYLYWYTQQLGMENWYNAFGFMSWRYSYFVLITILSCFIAQGLGFLIGILCVNSFNITIILSSSVLLFLFLFSGFFVKVFHMGQFAKLLTYFSFIRFSFESLLVILYGFDRCTTDSGSSHDFSPTISAVLYTFDLKDADFKNAIWWLLGHLILTRFFAFILLKALAEPKSIALFKKGRCCKKSNNSRTKPSNDCSVRFCDNSDYLVTVKNDLIL